MSNYISNIEKHYNQYPPVGNDLNIALDSLSIIEEEVTGNPELCKRIKDIREKILSTNPLQENYKIRIPLYESLTVAQENQFSFFGGQAACSTLALKFAVDIAEGTTSKKTTHNELKKQLKKGIEQYKYICISMQKQTGYYLELKEAIDAFPGYGFNDLEIKQGKLKPSPEENIKLYRTILQNMATDASIHKKPATGVLLIGKEYYSLVVEQKGFGFAVTFFDSHGKKHITGETGAFISVHSSLDQAAKFLHSLRSFISTEENTTGESQDDNSYQLTLLRVQDTDDLPKQPTKKLKTKGEFKNETPEIDPNIPISKNPQNENISELPEPPIKKQKTFEPIFPSQPIFSSDDILKSLNEINFYLEYGELQPARKIMSQLPEDIRKDFKEICKNTWEVFGSERKNGKRNVTIEIKKITIEQLIERIKFNTGF